MHYRFFTIRAIDAGGDTDALNAFLASNPILSIERQFVADGANSYWSLCVCIGEAAAEGEKSRKRGSVDYRELLPPEVFAVYAKLRTLRNRLAEDQGMPPFAIFNNEQLAAMAQLPEPSKAAMGTIAGVGEKRMAQYADQFLAILTEKPGAEN